MVVSNSVIKCSYTLIYETEFNVLFFPSAKPSQAQLSCNENGNENEMHMKQLCVNLIGMYEIVRVYLNHDMANNGTRKQIYIYIYIQIYVFFFC